MTLRIEIVNLTGRPSTNRAMAAPSTFWGTIGDQGFDSTTGTHTYLWTFSGDIPAYGTGDNEADMWLHGQDGLDPFNPRLTDEVRVTPLTSNTTLPPTLASIALASGQARLCQGYYDAKVAQFNQVAKPITFSADGYTNSGSADRYGDQTVALDETVRSSVIGDFRPAGAGDGIY